MRKNAQAQARIHMSFAKPSLPPDLLKKQPKSKHYRRGQASKCKKLLCKRHATWKSLCSLAERHPFRCACHPHTYHLSVHAFTSPGGKQIQALFVSFCRSLSSTSSPLFLF
eukprot:scaffold34_cov260-Pinguiococcus_pyrenoidosus.AAC.36